MKRLIFGFDFVGLLILGIAIYVLGLSYPAFSENFWYVYALPVTGIAFIAVSRILWWLWETTHEVTFRDRASLDAYLTKLVPTAHNIDVANFTLGPPSDPSGEEYMKVVADRVKNDHNFKFRRLLTIPSTEKLDWICETALALVQCPNFELKYVPESLAQKWPWQYMPTFLILDKKMLFAGFFYSTEGGLNMLLESKKVAKDFSKYFEHIWESSLYLKKPSSTEAEINQTIGFLNQRVLPKCNGDNRGGAK